MIPEINLKICENWFKLYGKESSIRIAFVSTYPPIECGIGTYTAFLTEALTKSSNEVHIVSQFGAEGRHVYPAYSPREDGLPERFLMPLLKLPPILSIFNTNSVCLVN